MAEAKQESKKQPKVLTVEPVYGLMVHPLSGLRIEGQVQVEALDDWLDAQVAAGKLRLVD